MSVIPNFYIDDKTLELAKVYDLDKKLVKRCKRSRDSLEKEDVIYHRNLQTQVYAVSKYSNKEVRKANNVIIHYGDKPDETLKDFPKIQQELKDKLKS